MNHILLKRTLVNVSKFLEEVKEKTAYPLIQQCLKVYIFCRTVKYGNHQLFSSLEAHTTQSPFILSRFLFQLCVIIWSNFLNRQAPRRTELSRKLNELIWFYTQTNGSYPKCRKFIILFLQDGFRLEKNRVFASFHVDRQFIPCLFNIYFPHVQFVLMQRFLSKNGSTQK